MAGIAIHCFQVSRGRSLGAPRYLPSYVRTVHSIPHLILLTGMIANVALFLRLVVTWKNWEEEKHAPADYTIVIASCIFAILTLQLLHWELVQYSVDLHSYSIQAQKSKDQMMQTFNGIWVANSATVSSILVFLGRVCHG